MHGTPGSPGAPGRDGRDVTSGFMDVTAAVAVGISPSMAPSAALLAPLTARFTCILAKTAIFIIAAILRVTITTFTRERCELVSGLEAATLAIRALTRTQAGIQCPGSSSKRCQRLSSKHVTRDKLNFLDKLKKTSLGTCRRTLSLIL